MWLYADKYDFNVFRYSAGGCQGIEQAGHVGRSLACLDKNDEGGSADDEGAGDLLAQRCQSLVQFYQKRAGWRAQKSGECSGSYKLGYPECDQIALKQGGRGQKTEGKPSTVYSVAADTPQFSWKRIASQIEYAVARKGER